MQSRRHPTKPLVRISSNPDVAVAQASTGPVAMHVNGFLVGLALKVDGRFMFFSAGHRTDEFDRKVFTSLAAIRDAVGEMPISPQRQ